jgi:cell wall-associated NlpC family hydrolase
MKTQTNFHKMFPGQNHFAVLAYNHNTGEYRVLGTVYNDPQDMPQPEYPVTPATQPIAVTINAPDGTNGNAATAALALVQDHPALPEGPWQLELYAMEGWFTNPS